MKKALSLLLALVMCLSLCACGAAEPAQTIPTSVATEPTEPDPAVAHQEVLDTIANASPNAMVYYGTYKQDDYKNKGEQPIAWIVLENKDGRVVLMAWKAIDCMPFDIQDDRIWQDSSIRAWLNDQFFTTAFTDLERSSILLSNVVTALPGEAAVTTQDRVYLLSQEELDHYYPEQNNINRLAKVTGYAMDRGLEAYSTTQMANSCNWWLRSGSRGRADVVGGQLGNHGEVFRMSTREKYGIRPIICIDVTK